MTLKEKIDQRLNDHLVGMRNDYDDSITVFNEAWEIVRAAFEEEPEADADLIGANARLHKDVARISRGAGVLLAAAKAHLKEFDNGDRCFEDIQDAIAALEE